VSQYEKGKTNLDFNEARDSEWQWHQLGRMQVCTLLQTDNHASTPALSFLQAGCPSCCPANSIKALKARLRAAMDQKSHKNIKTQHWTLSCGDYEKHNKTANHKSFQVETTPIQRPPLQDNLGIVVPERQEIMGFWDAVA